MWFNTNVCFFITNNVSFIRNIRINACLVPWYQSKSMMEIIDIHLNISGVSSMQDEWFVLGEGRIINFP